MDINLEEIKWQKRNFWVRIILIGILLFIAGYVMYYHYGYVDPDDYTLNYINGNSNVTCREATTYYAYHEWGLDLKNNKLLSNQTEQQRNNFDASSLNLSSLFIAQP